MLSHYPSHARALRVGCNHERGVGNMRAVAGLVRLQNVSAKNAAVFFNNVRARVGSKPVGQRLLARHLRIERVCVACSDNFMKDVPDRLVVRIGRYAYFHRSQCCRCANAFYPNPNATSRGSTIASEMSQELSLPIRDLAQISIAEAF